MKFILPFLLLLIAFGCEPTPATDKGAVLAKVQGHYFYESDLQGVIQSGTPARDSIILAKSFIDNWIRNRLLIRQAERNLSPVQLDFSKQLEDYRNSLIIYAYERELINQMLDTLVSEQEIEQHYHDNKHNFELKFNVVKAIYLTVPHQSEEAELFRELLTADSLMLDSIAYYANDYALSYHLAEDKWIRFDEMLLHIPIETINQVDFLENNSFVEIHNEPVSYLALIIDYRLLEHISPLDLVRDQIKNIILNKRKRLLIRQMQNDIYEQAMLEGLFEIY